MEERDRDRRWFWTTLILSSISIVATVFAIWELIEFRYFRNFNYVTLHYLYLTRGIASSLLLVCWAAWYVLRHRRQYEEQLHRSHEHYRGLVRALPGAVILFDSRRRVTEWNGAAERLYGFSAAEVVGNPLPTVPAEKEAELEALLAKVEAGESVLDLETQRKGRGGNLIDVQLSLLPYQEVPGSKQFLEVTADIHERVLFSQRLLEIEKLTTMGRMAAGIGHHLNTPLAAMLLRVQMMRDRGHEQGCLGDLERLEAGIGSCRQFVRRLLDFSRPPICQRQPEIFSRLIESVIGSLAPLAAVKQVKIAFDSAAGNGNQVLGDRNQLEAALLILLSNALDAVAHGGKISVRCRDAFDCCRVEIADDGCGIQAADGARIFEPFFTTKGPGKGTGLGLPMARNIVQEHGGKLWLESQPGNGTTVFLELPLAMVETVRGGSTP